MPSAATLDEMDAGSAGPSVGNGSFGDAIAPDAAAGVASLLAAGGVLSRSVATFAREHGPTAGREGALGSRGPTSLLSAQIAALLASLERSAGATADDDAPRRGPPSNAERAPTTRAQAAFARNDAPTAGSRPQSPAAAGSFALSLALLAADAEGHAPGGGDFASSSRPEIHRAGGRFAGRLGGGLFGNPSPLDHLSREDDAPRGGRPDEERQQRQLETLLRIERLLDEAVRLLRQPRAAAFAADTTGVP